MNVRDKLGARILMTVQKPHGFGSKTAVEQARVIEVSPSGQWTRLMNEHGAKFWTRTEEIMLVEVLTDAPTEPRPDRDGLSPAP